MMKNGLPILLVFGICTAFTAQAQEIHGNCGTTAEDQAQYTARLKANIATAKNSNQIAERGAVQYIPIYFHLVGDANGDGKAKERLVLDQLCALNEAYAPMEMRFYLKPHPTYGLFDYSINNNNVYNNQNNTFLMQNRRHNYALNVFLVNLAGAGNNVGTTLAYYHPSNDWVVSRKDQINGSPTNGTLAHEIGHFFSLRHTFYGYEQDGEDPDNEPPCFEPADPGWPIAPVLAPYQPGIDDVYTELQNGSNCDDAADLLCDTPPDYNFGFCENDCSSYTGGAKDPSGVIVDPMENNFMSYFSSCNYVFTSQQQAVVLADRETAERNYLDNNFAPVALEITTPPTDEFLLGPANNATTPYYDEVLLEWTPVDGATYYLLEMDWLNTYNTGNYRSYVVTGTSKFLTDLDDNRQYFWRVRPFNEYATCAQHRQRSFKTPLTSGVKDIEALSAMHIAPNPAAGDAPVRLFVSATDNFDASVLILDAMGRQLHSLHNIAFSAGETALDLPTAGLANGLYFVAIENGEGRTVRKMTIVR